MCVSVSSEEEIGVCVDDGGDADETMEWLYYIHYCFVIVLLLVIAG